MKKYTYYILYSMLCLLVAGCESIAEDDRYIELPAVEQKRNVLLEEFTGQDCLNCPDAHRAIEALKEQYGEALVSVSIHAGDFAVAEGTKPYPTFKTPEGDLYNDMWGIKSWPAGVVNRTSGVEQHAAWGASIRAELERPTTTDIDLTATLTEDNHISVTTTVSTPVDENAKLQLWVIENGLVSLQRDGSKIVPQYVHNHVYRASINGVGGEPLFDYTAPGIVSEKTLSHSIAVKDTWTPGNLRIVAFVYTTEGVQQVVETALASAIDN